LCQHRFARYTAAVDYKGNFMLRLPVIVIVLLSLFALQVPAHAAKIIKAAKPVKERLVLMPMLLGAQERSLQGAMETALIEGLEQKYEVYSGDRVRQKVKEIFSRESKVSKKECDETRCMEDIAIAFQAVLIAVANVTKQDGGYFLALSIQNIADQKAVYSKSLPCKGCDAFEVVEKLKELSGASATVATPTAPEPVVNLTPNNPESELWAEVKQANSIEYYTAYLKQYPKGKFAILAQSNLNKFKNEAAAEAAQQEKNDWDTAKSTATEESFNDYLNQYPKGKYIVLAQSSL
jgi:ribosomal protein L9